VSNKIINLLSIIGILFVIYKINIEFSTFSKEKEIVSLKKVDLDKYLDNKSEEVIGYLQIKNISLNEPLYEQTSAKNHVDYGLEIISDEENLVVASHSGNSQVAAFNNLYQLNIKTKAIVTLRKKTAILTLKSKTIIPKKNLVTIDQSCQMTLITCHQKDYRLVLCYKND